MASAIIKVQCSICNDDGEIYECKGCLKIFCFKDLEDHRETIKKEFYKIEDNYNLFRQAFNDQKENLEKCFLIKQIDKWKENSINKIIQKADECKQRLIKYTNKYHLEIENKLNKLTVQLKQIHEKIKSNEINLNQFTEQLNQLKEELEKSTNILIEQEPSSFINKIFVIIPFDKDTKWKHHGITIAGGTGRGIQLNQLYCPGSIFFDDNQTIYTADQGNDRIVEWKCNATSGQVVAGGNERGNETNQLNRPANVILDKKNNSFIISDHGNRRVMRWSRENNTENGEIIISNINCRGLAMDKDGSLYVCDSWKSEVRRWKRGEENGTIVAGGNGKGDHLNQFDYPTFIFVDEDYSLYVSDMNNHRVMKWMKDAQEGVLVAGGHGLGNSLTQLSSPGGVVVDQLGQIYVADWGNDRVMRWCKGTKEGTVVVGGKGEGQQSNQFNCPNGLSFDREGNLYVVDCRNNRIQRFEID